MRVKPLSDRILDALPSMDAPTVSDMAARLGFDVARVRTAFDTLEAEGRAKIMRRGNGLHLVPLDYRVRICPVCRAEVTNKNRRVRCCSKSCSSTLMWRTRDRVKQSELMRATRKRYPETMKAGVVALVGTPEHREHLRQLQKKLWADPVNKMKRVVSMERAWQGPQGEPRKAKASTKKLSLWSDPDWKARTMEAMRTGKRGRYQRALIQMVGEGADAEEIAVRTGRTLEQTRVLWRRLYRLGKVDRQPVDGRKMRPVRPKRSARPQEWLQ